MEDLRKLAELALTDLPGLAGELHRQVLVIVQEVVRRFHRALQAV